VHRCRVQQSNWQSKHSRPSGVLSCWPDGLELTPGFYPSGIQRAAQTVLGVCLKRTCSRVTRASSALGVLTDMRYTNPRTHSLQGHGTDRRTDAQIAALRNASVMGGSRPCTTRRKIVDVDLNLQKKHEPCTVYSSSIVYGYSSSQSNLPHRYGNSHAVWDHTVLPATRQK